MAPDMQLMDSSANADEALKGGKFWSEFIMSYQLIYRPEKILIGYAAEPGQALSDLMMPYDVIRCHNNW
jgi:hypothetical protein